MARDAAPVGLDGQRVDLDLVVAVFRVGAQPHQRFGGVVLQRAARLGEHELVGASARHIALGDHRSTLTAPTAARIESATAATITGAR